MTRTNKNNKIIKKNRNEYSKKLKYQKDLIPFVKIYLENNIKT